MSSIYPIRNTLKDGLSGIMRVRNEERFIESCIDSCVNSLDELVIVYTGCTDNTENILNRKVKQYPDKLKLYKYDYDVMWYGLNKEEYEYAINLPDSDCRLYANLCNYALSKIRFKYAVKIDTDQLYFAEEIQFWRDVCARKVTYNNFISLSKGWLFTQYLALYRRYSVVKKEPALSLIPDALVKYFKPYYLQFAAYMLLRNKVVVAWSGVNVFYDKKWTIPFDGVNIHPPYNGEGDTVVFKVSEKSFYSKHVCNTSKTKDNYSVTEDFNINVKKIMFAGPVWFHLHANRSHCFNNVRDFKKKHPECFISPDDFLVMQYEEVHNKMDHQAHSLYQRILFALIHKFGISTIKKNLGILDKLGI